MAITPKPARIAGEEVPEERKLSPVKLMAPLPFATTLAPTCSSVMVKAWAGWTEKSDVQATAVRASRILGKGFMPRKGSIRCAKLR